MKISSSNTLTCLVTVLLSVPFFAYGNEVPIVQTINKNVNEDKLIKIALKGKDPEHKKLSYAIAQKPSHGEVTINGGNVIYKPQANYNGLDSFQYTASDGESNSEAAAVNLIVKPVNDKPVAMSQTQTVAMGASSTISLAAIDVDGDDLRYVIATKPKHGKVVLNGSIATYTPKNTNFQGSDRFTFKAKDKKSTSKSAKVNVIVEVTGINGVGLDDLSFGAGDSAIYILEGSTKDVALNLALNPDTQLADIDIQASEGQSYVSASKVAGQWMLVADSKNLSAGVSVPIELTLSNVKLGTSTKKVTTLQILAPTHTEKTMIDSAGGALKTSAGTIEVLSNNLPSSVEVTIKEGVTPTGGLMYLISFDGDVSTANLEVILPDPNTIAPSITATSNSPVIKASKVSAQAAIESYNFSVPYQEDEKSLGHSWGDLKAWFTDGGDHRLRSGVPLSTSGLFNGTKKANSFEVHVFPASRLYSVIPYNKNPIDIGNYEPVLFVHGFGVSFTTATLGGGKGTWGQFPRLATYDWKLNDIGLIPFEFQWATDARFSDVAGDLVKRINEIHKITGKKINVVAHSFGGVLVRTVLQDLAYGPTQNEKDDARVAVKSLLTLGSPHSGIADNITNTNPPLPPGQDASSFEACDQLSCYAMGEDIFVRDDGNGSDPSINIRTILGVEASPGEHALLLANTVNKLPNIPILIGIGLTADRGFNNKFDNGDYLISYRGQRL